MYFCPACEVADPPIGAGCGCAKIAEPVTLIPCPWCGGPPKPVHHVKPVKLTLRRRMLQLFRPLPPWGGTGKTFFVIEAHVFCHECGARSAKADDFIDSRDELPEALPVVMERAILAWNTRNQRHRDLYEAGAEDGLNRYPRKSAP